VIEVIHENVQSNSGTSGAGGPSVAILINKAMNRQTMTYEGLSRLMYGKDAAGVLAGILGHVAFYCKENHIPPLTTLVVGNGTREAGRSNSG
jgi:hypothetical protein